MGVPLMRRYRDPTPALQRPEPHLPLSEKIWCAIVVMIVVVATVWISVRLG